MSNLIVLTGATGFLGRHLCRALLAHGYDIAAFRRPASDLARLGPDAQRVRWHLAPEQLEAPFRGPQAPLAVIHCAALYGRKGETPAQLIEANTLLPVRLYRLAAERGVPAFLHTDTILDPGLNPYALSKHQAAQWLRLLAGPTRVLNLRVQHFYGPHDDPIKFITHLIAQCLAHAPDIPLTDGRQRRDFIFVSDVVSAMLALLQSGADVSPGSCGGAGVSPASSMGVSPVSFGQDAQATGAFAEVQIGSGEPVAVRELAELIHKLTGSRSRLLFGALPYRPGEPMLTCADTAPLRALGWRPLVPLAEGLTRTIEAQRAAGPNRER